MPRTTTYSVTVQFGDCDPGGIVFFPNFCRWMDAASLTFFMQCGVKPWRTLENERGIVGTPLLEIHTKFHKTATYGDTLTVHTHIDDWRRVAFTQVHRVTRGDELICEGREVRAFVTRDPHDRERLRAIPVPEDIQALCS
ncbi:acyl-CoA thioesterase [Rhizobacter sp. J219]|uniref:acyl-CoA thioesterase n=1 Tax=Rhizobacter sp. J219 TaxID=2898430 RepID=UPI0021519E08|nr:thioesterase family protein [Rhizobacter sp. J219]MCR5885055.1 acyl-CoA thioesterase [Rhizobacter sp. J219]